MEASSVEPRPLSLRTSTISIGAGAAAFVVALVLPRQVVDEKKPERSPTAPHVSVVGSPGGIGFALDL